MSLAAGQPREVGMVFWETCGAQLKKKSTISTHTERPQLAAGTGQEVQSRGWNSETGLQPYICVQSVCMRMYARTKCPSIS